MDKKVTISEVADRAGVSKATVSNYLNKRYDRMKEETKKRIQEAIDSLDYVPSISARRLSAKEKSKTIGLIIPRNLAHVFDTMYYPTVFNAIGKISEETGYSVLIYVQNKQVADDNLDYLLGLAKSLVDGFLIFALSPEDRYFKEFEKNKIPYVCVGEIPHYVDYNFVATDHGQGIRDAVNYLIELGHKKIALVTEDKLSVVDEARKNTYKQVLMEHGIDYEKKYCRSFLSEEVTEQVPRFLKGLFEDKDRPTGILIPANLLHYLKKAVKENDLYIPKDLSVIAIDYYDIYYPEYVRFQDREYTKIPSAAYKVSEKAFEKLIELIENPEKGFASYLEPVKLEIGKTTGVKREEV
ncbi:MAG: LacI family DNA-binding transcriptional regulator [Eubacteriales bacterium]|nr:LacI family DNA-binding transcriptional regulator [Eubacteriales bacterium]